MLANIATGSAAPSVQKLIIEVDVENQLRSQALLRRLQDKRLSRDSTVLYLRCYNLTAIGWGNQQAFSQCPSLLRVDLSGLPKLESIPELAFAECHHLVSVVFGEHSNITNLGPAAFSDCYALVSVSLPDKLEIIEELAFAECSSLERVVCNEHLKIMFQNCSAFTIITLLGKLEVIEELAFAMCTSLKSVVCNKTLKTIGDGAFQYCSKLKDVQLASS